MLIMMNITMLECENWCGFLWHETGMQWPGRSRRMEFCTLYPSAAAPIEAAPTDSFTPTFTFSF